MEQKKSEDGVVAPVFSLDGLALNRKHVSVEHAMVSDNTLGSVAEKKKLETAQPCVGIPSSHPNLELSNQNFSPQLAQRVLKAGFESLPSKIRTNQATWHGHSKFLTPHSCLYFFGLGQAKAARGAKKKMVRRGRFWSVPMCLIFLLRTILGCLVSLRPAGSLT